MKTMRKTTQAERRQAEVDQAQANFDRVMGYSRDETSKTYWTTTLENAKAVQAMPEMYYIVRWSDFTTVLEVADLKEAMKRAKAETTCGNHCFVAEDGLVGMNRSKVLVYNPKA